DATGSTAGSQDGAKEAAAAGAASGAGGDASSGGSDASGGSGASGGSDGGELPWTGTDSTLPLLGGGAGLLAAGGAMAAAAHLRRKKAADAESGETAVDEPSRACPHDAAAPKQRRSAETTMRAPGPRRSTVVSPDLCPLCRCLGAGLRAQRRSEVPYPTTVRSWLLCRLHDAQAAVPSAAALPLSRAEAALRRRVARQASSPALSRGICRGLRNPWRLVFSEERCF